MHEYFWNTRKAKTREGRPSTCFLSPPPDANPKGEPRDGIFPHMNCFSAIFGNGVSISPVEQGLIETSISHDSMSDVALIIHSIKSFSVI